jgi:hypothetical protein
VGLQHPHGLRGAAGFVLEVVDYEDHIAVEVPRLLDPVAD